MFEANSIITSKKTYASRVARVRVAEEIEVNYKDI